MRRRRAFVWLFGQQSREETLHIGRHDDAVAGGCDQPLELRQLPAFSAEVKRLDIEQRVFNGNGEKIAANYSGAGLVPERKLLRDGGILIDARFYLCRTINELVF